MDAWPNDKISLGEQHTSVYLMRGQLNVPTCGVIVQIITQVNPCEYGTNK